MKAVVTAQEMRDIDARTIDAIGLPGAVLMENAGRAVAAAVHRARARGRVAVVCGSGNNGGDGYVCARVLREWGRDARVYLAGSRSSLKGDARVHFDAYVECGGPVVDISSQDALEREAEDLGSAAVVVDAIFGTGLDRPVEGHYRAVIEAIEGARGRVVAVDLPSGLHADTGQPLGVCVDADYTVTVAFHKPATVSAPGFARCGEVTVAEIGIPASLGQRARIQLVEPEDARARMPASDPLDYKNRRGHLLVVAGSPGKRGAGRLTALAGLRSGAGLVTLAATTPDEGADPSVMSRELAAGESDVEAACRGMAAVAIGPGMDPSERGRAQLETVLAAGLPMVIDADGLRHLAQRPELGPDGSGSIDLGEQVVLTPHPGEAGLLLGCGAKEVESDRVMAARRIAGRTGAVCVLKGARTLIAWGDDVYVNPSGGPELATAGSGDVLTGIVGGLLAQGLSGLDAAVLAVFVHGRAGERGAGRGLISSDLPDLLPEALAALGAAHGARTARRC